MKVKVLYSPRGIITATEYQAMCLNLFAEFKKELDEKTSKGENVIGQWVSLELSVSE